MVTNNNSDIVDNSALKSDEGPASTVGDTPPVVPPAKSNGTGPSVPPVTSSLNSSAMVPIVASTKTATTSAQTSVTQSNTPPAKTFSGAIIGGVPANLTYDALPSGFSTTPPLKDPNNPSSGYLPYTTISTQWGPVYQTLGAPVNPNAPAGTGTTVTPPQGYTAGTPDAQGNVTYSNTQTGHNFTLPANVANPSQVANNVVAVQSQVASSLGTGYNTTVSQNGDIAITNAQGQTVTTISPEVASSPASLSEAMGQISSYNTTLTAASSSMAASNASNDTQYQEQTQQLSEERDAAVAEELAASGGGLGSNAEAVSAVKTKYDQLQSNLDSAYQAQKLAIASDNTTAIANANSSLASALSTVTENAKQTVISLQSNAQTNFLQVAKTFDVSTATMPSGQTLANLTVGANGTTGVPAVDTLIQQGVQAGYTPQQALGLVQAGVATQNKNNQAQFLGLLQQASYANGWASLVTTPDGQKSLLSNPLFNAYVGMAQTYIPSLAGDKQAAINFVAGGTIQQQKTAITATGSPTGATLTGQGGGAIGTIATGTTNDSTFLIPGTGGITQGAVDNAATQLNSTGKMPPLGLGSSGTTKNARLAILNRAAQLQPNGLAVVQMQQLISGAQTTIDTASTQKATVDSAINNVNYSLGLLLGDGTTANPGLVNQVNFGTDVVWNKATGYFVSNVGAGATPQQQATIGKYLQALNAATNEYGKVLYGNGTATDSSRSEAGDAINGYFAAMPQTQVLNQIQGELQARSQGIQEVIDGTASDILNGMTTDSNGNPVFSGLSGTTASSTDINDSSNWPGF